MLPKLSRFLLFFMQFWMKTALSVLVCSGIHILRILILFLRNLYLCADWSYKQLLLKRVGLVSVPITPWRGHPKTPKGVHKKG